MNDQSMEIDELQKNNTNSEENFSEGDLPAIIESARKEAEQKSQEKCQQDLSKYSACMSEHNAKMAEYNTCLTKRSDPNYLGYRPICLEPYNHCFKPSCAF